MKRQALVTAIAWVLACAVVLMILWPRPKAHYQCAVFSLCAVGRESGVSIDYQEVMTHFQLRPDESLSFEQTRSYAKVFRLNLFPIMANKGSLVHPGIAELDYGHFVAVLRDDGATVTIADSSSATSLGDVQIWSKARLLEHWTGRMLIAP